jgi:hypothetical protein
MRKSNPTKKQATRKSLEQKYKEIAAWEFPTVNDKIDLSQPDVSKVTIHETYVTYGVPPGF